MPYFLLFIFIFSYLLLCHLYELDFIWVLLITAMLELKMWPVISALAENWEPWSPVWSVCFLARYYERHLQPCNDEATHSSSIHIHPLRHFEEVTTAVIELREKPQDVLTDMFILSEFSVLVQSALKMKESFCAWPSWNNCLQNNFHSPYGRDIHSFDWSSHTVRNVSLHEQ